MQPPSRAPAVPRPRWLPLVAGALALACGGAPGPATEVPRAAPSTPLATLVPEGATLVVATRPAALFGHPATRRVLRALWPDERLEAFRGHTGVDLEGLDALWLVEHPEGTVAFARGRDLDAPFAVAEAGERMAPIEAQRDAPEVRRVGLLGRRRVDLAALGPHTVLWVEGTPQLAGAILEAARGPEEARAHPFRTPLVASLLRLHGEAPFALFGPRPLGLPVDRGIGLLLAEEEALAATATPRGDDALALLLDLRGAFPPGAAGNFHHFGRAIADSDLGAAVGARDALPSLRVEASGDRVLLEAEVGARIVATGLRTLFVAEMAELLALEGVADVER